MTGPRLAHVGIHESLNRNAGDTLLFEEVRHCLAGALPGVTWDRRQLWEPLDGAGARALSAECDGVVVGGGGLLLRDQAGSDSRASGWQWNATVEAVRALDVPLVVFAVGYNRFRGQADFDPVFTEHLTAVVEQAAFVGLRNRGSIRAVAGYLPAALHDRLRLQPCPTTLLWSMHDEWRRPWAGGAAPRLRLNVAFDRPEMRFGADPDQALDAVAQAMGHADRTGWEVLVTCHKPQDHQILPYLDVADVRYEVEDLTDAGPSRIVAAYAACDLAVGLRGHAQMIPFGLRRPIISVESHDKMRWFLEDVGHPEWGVDIAHPKLQDELCDRIDLVAADPERVVADVAAAQDRLWALTQANLESIRRILA